MYNWGPFAGFHRATFGAHGTAVIGPTGSGKTTLVDALMTLLVSQPRYNLASTGGHESDRTLVSYIRGVLGGDGADGREDTVRPGKTITGICATYSNGTETLRMAGLLWTDGTSNATSDLKRRWIFSQSEDHTLEHWLSLLHDNGARELMRAGRETANLWIFESKKTYLAHARKFFDVSENAFTLLNRAAGLKQLNSIDEIFRELVLDDRSAFDRAIEVAGEFDNLAAIRSELETARRQQQSLLPIEAESKKLEKTIEKRDHLELVKKILPTWFALEAQKRWQILMQAITENQKVIQSQIEEVNRQEEECRSQVEVLREQYLQLGGNVVRELENTVNVQTKLVAERQRHAEDYRRIMSRFELSDELTESALLSNQESLRNRRDQILQKQKRKKEELFDLLSRKRDLESKEAEAKSALQKVKDRPGSNIPPPFQDFRSELAQQLGLKDDGLPFLAEMVEVQSNQISWRGAIERAIGSERLRILVPESDLRTALDWVNHRNNRLHIRLQRAIPHEAPSKAFADGFVKKLNFKDHELQGSAQRLLARRDLHCVDSSDALRTTEHALTIQGMMSGRAGRFEKQDRYRLDEGWMTGFDNKDQLESLAKNILKFREKSQPLTHEAKSLNDELSEIDGRLSLIDHILTLDFSTIDLPSANAELVRYRDKLTVLLDPNSNASKAKQQYDLKAHELDQIRGELRGLETDSAIQSDKLFRAESGHKRASQRAGKGLVEHEAELAEKHFKIPDDTEIDELPDIERQKASKMEDEYSKQINQVADHERCLVRLMQSALHLDTGSLAEVGSELEDIPKYLERLQVLNEEALPEKQQRFLNYLNESSDQGVTQLLRGIDEEVDAIEHRMDDLNYTLMKVDFRFERYLQLKPQRVKHERLRALETAIRRLRSESLKDDSGESQYKALRDLVDILREASQNRRQRGSLALLDPRYRLQFYVVEIDRKTGDCSPPRTGSQSGSGGEKELMASHILTASLSYALCPTGEQRPLYGTVVLDEAFSKSSPSAATRIIEALRIFHLHPIFVTPNKEVSLLKKHTRKVICVQRIGKNASLASISWEKLEDMAHRK